MNSTSNPAISVIVPVYKAEKYIHRCLDSIINQTFKDFELILVDDGSPDRSGEICDEYAKKDKRVRVIHRKNEGVSIARNIGIDVAKSELICFVDSDDWVEDIYLYEFIKNNDDNNIVFQGILYDFEYNPSKNTPFFKYDKISFPINKQEYIVKYNILANGCPVGKIFRKSILNKYNIRFNEYISTHEDHLFVWQYIQHISTITLSDKISYHYMNHNVESLSSKFHNSEEYLLVSNYLLNEIEKIINLYNIENKEYIKNTYSSFGLTQLFYAMLNSKSTNFNYILSEVKCKLDVLNKYYIPTCGIYNLLHKCMKIGISNYIIFAIIKIYKLLR